MQTLHREIIRLENVYVAYSGTGRPAIADITLTIGVNKLVLITGPNGAGKTTLIETCLGLLKPLRGTAKLLGIDTRSRRIIDARKKCSYVPQDFMKPPYETYTARQVIELGLAPIRSIFPQLDRRSFDNRIEYIADLLEIKDLLDRPIGTLSGGQQQKVFIARALIRNPKIIFLDEPFASLDRESRKIVSRTVKAYVSKNRASAIVVSHDSSTIKDLADVIIEMDKGRIVKVLGDPI